ncbi:MAG: hypothetical protein LBK71_03700, partial [Verrucomicrobiales bacterium]|nr:hypothetical protein [Verrucomicrobiales bacterium]
MEPQRHPTPSARLTWAEIRANAARFADTWKTASRENADKQLFWHELLAAFGLPSRVLGAFEVPVATVSGGRGFIDFFWKGVMLVEHKSRGADIDTAQQQAIGYVHDLAADGRHNDLPRFIVLCDFARFRIIDLDPQDHRLGLPLFDDHQYHLTEFTLSDLPQHVRDFAFLVGEQRVRVHTERAANIKAAQLLADLHDSLSATNYPRRELERYLVRLLFCLFAEDSFIFEPQSFTELIRHTEPRHLGGTLAELWWTLDTEPARRQRHATFDLFPHVNGGLFADRLPVCHFDTAQRDALLRCCDYQWAKISPAIFGSLFQGVMDDQARRQLGAHYTGERDIMKLLNDLFLNELRDELRLIVSDRSSRRVTRLKEFPKKLRHIKLLDPACGCGNFLILAYRELRVMENAVIVALHRDAAGQVQTELDIRNLACVDVDQFYGIEISEWPARIAKVGLWLQDHQSNSELAEKMGQQFKRLPLKAAPHIHLANALTVDWEKILPPSACSYVLGNPPFVGKHLMTVEQSQDMERVFGTVNGTGILDYVTAWYVKAVEYMQKNFTISAAFVSTNSITQGEQPGALWSRLFQRGVKIHFAHHTFKWASEAPGKAHVHCVIIGFGIADRDHKKIYDYVADDEHSTISAVKNINPYLIEGADSVITSRSKPLCDVPSIIYGNKPADGGHLIIEENERAQFIKDNPSAAPYVRPMVSAEEFLHGQRRYCLWLVDAPPKIIAENPGVKKRVQACKDFRLASKKAPTREVAKTPSLFAEIRQPKKTYILVPLHTSETRTYIPFGYFTTKTIVHNSCAAIPEATLYHFGVLSSAMHMAWTKQVCGRLESRYRYSNKLVYNNFPWPTPSAAQRAKVEQAARAVLNIRANYPTATLANLYDPLTMPPLLVKAHTTLEHIKTRWIQQATAYIRRNGTRRWRRSRSRTPGPWQWPG